MGAIGLPSGSAIGARSAPLPGQHQAARALARQRLSVLLLLFVAVPPVLALRLGELALFDAAPAAATPATATTGERADIVDRNGVELARTFSAYAISVEPRRLASEPRALARRIAAILTDRSEDEIYAELTHRGSFRYIARRVLPAEAKRINDLGEPAIRLGREAERLYPNFSLGAHLIGYADNEGHGAYGVEKAFDARLTDPARRNDPLRLAVDVRVQQALDSELRAIVADQQAEGAAGVVLDVNSGEVVAMVSLPDFNPNAPGKDGQPAFNKASYGRYELGSTFKALTIASGLESGVIKSMQQRYDATRPMPMAGFVIHDDHPQNSWLTVPEVFIHSSNIGTARIALEVGRERQRAMLEAIGFMKPVEIELPELRNPQLPPLSNWGDLATMTISYGHGITVTPLHLASAYATLVNGGIYRPLTLLRRDGPPPAGRRVFSEKTSAEMRQLLRLTVTAGTGRKADAAGYRVGGKTGTAEKNENGRYVRGANVSTFAAAFPMDAPRYVVVTMIDNPRGSKATYGFRTAGMVIAPVVGRLVTRIGPLLGVTPDPARDLDTASLMPTPAAVVE